MKYFQQQPILAALLLAVAAQANNVDMFNFDKTRDGIDGNDDFGPVDWNRVTCEDTAQCLGFPDPWKDVVGWDPDSVEETCEICVDNEVDNNNCKWCPAGGDCGQTRQSPINLERNRGLTDDPMFKECPDWHRMKFFDGSCTWDDLVDNENALHRNNFLIRRHALQILQPVDENGDLQCFNKSVYGEGYPRLDYSKGFPNWWFLAHTEISVPSQHTQEGKRYDAEVSMAHFYETDLPKNELGIVSVFLTGSDKVQPWPMLDKLICQFRETEEQVRKDCGLDSVDTFYPGCTNYNRGLPPSTPLALAPGPTVPAPSPIPTANATKPSVFPRCHICGASNLTITKPDVQVQLPSFPKLNCSDLQQAGLVGMIHPDFCSSAPEFVDRCGCEATNSTDGNGTSVTDPTDNNVATIPPAFDCPSFSFADVGVDVNYRRICSICCESDHRSATDFCHDAYSFFNTTMSSVCFHCCDTPMILAPAPAPHPKFPPIECADVENPFRMCNKDVDTSCCRAERSDTQYCNEVYDQFGDMMDSVCWYCCETPTLLGPPLDQGARNLRASKKGSPQFLALPYDDSPERQLELLKKISERDEDDSKKKERLDALRNPVAEARMHYLKVPPEQKPIDYTDEDDDAHFQMMMDRHLLNEQVVKPDEDRSQRRLLNYDDVDYWPYEWLIKVGTEYYFRYEGTQTVPPCKDQVHWRAMKDPIVVAWSQIAELERLLVERIAPEDSEFKQCKPDHAGSPRVNTPDKFDFVRPLQQNHKLHRTVFCECKNWKSPFKGDQQWCDRNILDRFYSHPYNFESTEF